MRDKWDNFCNKKSSSERSQASCLCSIRFAGETLASQDRGRLACTRLYSTANERGFVQKIRLKLGLLKSVLKF
ncbi:MAG: hypothetical protein LBP59_05285 [Planctomycetaceae bacterium]|nr:hypothetical protein [Planctomycetaceae bacterium]